MDPPLRFHENRGNCEGYKLAFGGKRVKKGTGKDLANLWGRRNITKKACAGRGLEAKWEIPDE
jgi:hypothetical protein